MVQGADGGMTRAQMDDLIQEKIAPLKKDIDEIKAMLQSLLVNNKIEHGKLKQNTEAILEDTDSIRRNVEPTDESF